MSRTKQGDKPITREAWTMLGHEHQLVAHELSWLVDRSIATLAHLLDGNTRPPDTDGNARGSQVEHSHSMAAIARGRAEEEIFGSTNPDDMQSAVDKIGAEFECLVSALIRLSDSHKKDAEAALRLAASVGPGRPAASKNSLMALVKGVPRQKPSKRRRPGPPTVIPISDEDLLNLIEKGRRELGDTTTRASLSRFAKGHVQAMGVASSWNALKQESDLIRNLEKRASRLKKRTSTFHDKY